MEELMITVLGGIGTVLAALAAAFGEAIFEALGELLGELFGAAAEAGGETVGAITESGTYADLVALGAVAVENNGNSGISGVPSLPHLYFDLPSRRTAPKDGWLRPDEDEETETTKESVASSEETVA